MNLENFPLDYQDCAIKISTCKSSESIVQLQFCIIDLASQYIQFGCLCCDALNVRVHTEKYHQRAEIVLVLLVETLVVLSVKWALDCLQIR